MADILLIGKPNTGKTLLFNRLTGLQQKVANYPGVTVQVKQGRWDKNQLIDFPGTYSLTPLTQDEDVAVQEFRYQLQRREVELVLCVLDATQLERSLFFALQAAAAAHRAEKKIIFVLNMMDDIINNKLKIDSEGLARELHVPVVPVSGKTQFGLDVLKKTVDEYLKKSVFETTPPPETLLSKNLAMQYGAQSDVLMKKMNRLDQIFLSTFFGGAIFLVIMAFLFQAIFSWATPLMDATEFLITSLGHMVSPLVPAGWVRDFVDGAVFGGIGTFVVFVPQIFILTFIIGLMEDSGYLSRVAIICHKPLRVFGLSGKSFIPFLSGHACAIPAIYAARMIESPKKRLITLLTIPLISCSARLPIYALFIAALIPKTKYLGGLVSLQGLVFFALFLLGYVVALLVSSFYSKVIYKSKSDAPFVIELPAYRIPLLKPLLFRSVRSAWEFLSSAGPTIFTVVVAVWVLAYFPYGAGHLNESWLAQIGHWFEPFVRPLGLDWRYGVAILTSFIAREVFVGTLGTFYGIDSAEDNVTGLAEKIGMGGLSLASGVALLVFYVIALQCVSTLVTLRRETGSQIIPIAVFLFYTLLAYGLALISYQLLVS